MSQSVPLAVSNRLLHFFENDNYDAQRRNIVIAVVNKFISSNNYLNIVQVAIKNNASDVLSVAQVPKIISIIISCTNTMKTDKSLSSSDMKFFIYGVLLTFIMVEDSTFFNDIDPNLFEKLYDGMYELIQLSPKLVEVAKTTLTLCC